MPGNGQPHVDDATATDKVPTGGTPPGFRRLHPLTPLLKGWVFVAGAVAVLGQNAVRGEDLGRTGILIGAMAVFGIAAGVLTWWFTRFGFDGDALRIDSGIVNKRSRRVRLDRLQAVDIQRRLVARLLGMAELRLEVAGGTTSEAPLQYLSQDDATVLRAELLARAAGIESDAPEAPERALHEVPLPRLVWSTVLSWTFIIGAFVVVGLGTAVIAAPEAETTLAVGSAMLPGLIGVGAAIWQQFGRNFGFTLSESPDGMRIRKGLLDTQHQTVPPGRVQGVRVRQPLLWRKAGWVTLHVDVAGYGGAGARSGRKSSTLRPVVTLDGGRAV